MGFVLHKLALNPQVQEKAHEEVLSVVGNDGIITDEAMHKLSYVKAIQKETARCTCHCLESNIFTYVYINKAVLHTHINTRT